MFLTSIYSFIRGLIRLTKYHSLYLHCILLLIHPFVLWLCSGKFCSSYRISSHEDRLDALR